MNRLEALLARSSGAVVEIPSHVDTTVPLTGFGPEGASIVLVLDKPTDAEREQQTPWVGRRGTKLLAHARMAGIDTRKIRTVYVEQDSPEAFLALLCAGKQDLIITVGDEALQAVMALPDSLRRRGSVYHFGSTRVLCMLDPSITYARKEYEKPARLDWERAKELITPHTTHHHYCGCAHQMSRTHITPFGRSEAELGEAIAWYENAASKRDTVMAIDIETPKIEGKRRIVCVSFAVSAVESLVLPFDSQPLTIARLCQSVCRKVGHNFISFDRWWLAKESIQIGGPIDDTLAMHHCLDPASKHSLEFLTSRYTYEPFYKDEGKGHDEHVIWRDRESRKAYYDYCGLDSCVTRELYTILRDKLRARRLEGFYETHYVRIFDPILDLSSRGVRIDHAARLRLLEECLNEAREARDKLGAINGEPLYKASKNASAEVLAKKTVSSAQLKTLLYDKLGVPEQVKKRASGEMTPTADAVTLKKLRVEYAETRPEVVEVIDLALAHNKAHKMASFCYDSHFSEDGRFRFTLKVNTEAARLSSSAAPDGTGANSQNSPRDKRFRRLFLPEEGHILVDVDLSQVESRICFAYTGDAELARLARLRSSEFDQHKFVASIVFKKEVKDVTKDERQVSKSIGHGAQRAMQGLRMSETLMNVGYVFSPEECDELLEEYHKAFPAIRVWHQQVRKMLRAAKCLFNSWGRIWDVQYEDMNDELYRRGYSWILQSECADLMNQRGFIPLRDWMKAEKMRSRILLHTHDGLLMSCPVTESYEVAQFLVESLEVTREYNGVPLSVPVEVSVGKTWGDKQEFAFFPGKQAFLETVRGL
jgi:DNA polymerase I-like protein with 3'-5' exonuclease and polymerase domains/uracil-DNA glycosylase